MSIDAISLIGIFVALACFVTLAYKGVHMIGLSVLCAVIAALFGRINAYTALTQTFMPGFANFVSNYFLLFLISSIFAKVMQESGALTVIADKLYGLCRKAHPKHQRLVAVMMVPLINFIVIYGGVHVFAAAFVVVVITKELFEELDIPWHFYAVGTLGSSTVSQFIPGSSGTVNLIAADYFGTSPMAAPVLGFVGVILNLIIGVGYIVWAVNKSVKKAEGFLPTGRRIREEIHRMPEVPQIPVWQCVLPMICMWVLLNIVNITAVLSLGAATLVATVIFFNKLKGKVKICLSEGSTRAITTLALLSAAVGFGNVITTTPGYAYASVAIADVSLPPAIKIFVIMNVIAGLTNSSSGAVSIALNAMGEQFLATGIAPVALHRLVVAAPLGLDTLPHAPGVAQIGAVTKMDHKEFYIHILWLSCIVSIIVAFVMAIMIEFGIQA